MATVTGLFGTISGKVGNVVYRKRGGKTIVALRPCKRSTPKNQNEIEREIQFGLTGRISKGINSIEILKSFWRPVGVKSQSRYNIIFKNNYGLMRADNLSGNLKMTPGQGFEIINPGLYQGEGNLVVECKALGNRSDFDTVVEKYVTAAGIVVMKDPVIISTPEFVVLPFQSKKYLFYPNDYMSLNIEFTGNDLFMFGNYRIKKAFAIFITMDEEERPVQHSITFSSGE